MTLPRCGQVKLLGDSLTAGAGSSDFAPAGPPFVEIGGIPFCRSAGACSWAALFSEAVARSAPGCRVLNNGCCNLFSHELLSHLDELSDPEDSLTLVMIGTNNRRLPDGIALLYRDLSTIAMRLQSGGRAPVLIAPPPAAEGDERQPTRFFPTAEVAQCVARVAREQALPFVNLYWLLHEHLAASGRTLDSFFAGTDGLHPDDRGHRQLFTLLWEALCLHSL